MIASRTTLAIRLIELGRSFDSDTDARTLIHETNTDNEPRSTFLYRIRVLISSHLHRRVPDTLFFLLFFFLFSLPLPLSLSLSFFYRRYRKWEVRDSEFQDVKFVLTGGERKRLRKRSASDPISREPNCVRSCLGREKRKEKRRRERERKRTKKRKRKRELPSWIFL